MTDDPKEVAILEGLQRKIRFDQERAKKSMPAELRQRIEKDEFIHCCSVEDFTLLGKYHYVITDKKLLAYRKSCYN